MALEDMLGRCKINFWEGRFFNDMERLYKGVVRELSRERRALLPTGGAELQGKMGP